MSTRELCAIERAQRREHLSFERHRLCTRIRAHIVEAAEFDAYALRPRLTKYLAERFGYEIYINGRCQPPCGKYGVAVPDPEVP